MRGNRRVAFCLAALAGLVCACGPTLQTAHQEGKILDTSLPVSSEGEHVALFRDQTAFVRAYGSVVLDGGKDRDAAREEGVRALVLDLKKQAFLDAAQAVNRALSQPLDAEKFARAVAEADRDYASFVTDWKLVRQELRKGENEGPEQVKLTVYFKIDKVKLRKALVDSGALTPVAKYRTYVEVFWNTPKGDLSPEVVNTVIENVEDHLAQTGYEVLQFEQLRGKLVQLLNDEGKDTSDLASADELKRFKANLDLRNVDGKFASGKRILADYADVLVGVTVNTVEVTPDQLMQVRVTVNATLFERGQWVSLASSDKTAALPYVRGSTDNVLAASKKAARELVADLEPKVRQKLSARKAVETVKTQSARDFTLVFQGFTADEFARIRRSLNGSAARWSFHDADPQAGTVSVGYEGRKDALADQVGLFLEGAGLPVGLPQFSGDGSRIVYAKKK